MKKGSYLVLLNDIASYVSFLIYSLIHYFNLSHNNKIYGVQFTFAIFHDRMTRNDFRHCWPCVMFSGVFAIIRLFETSF